MADVFSKKKRSLIMSRVKGKDTKPEILLGRILRRLKYRVRRNVKSLPGSPDAVLQKERVALFVHGCFWHGHESCRRSRLPKTNKAFWRKKVEKNRKRDRRQIRELRKKGWSVAVFWTCNRLTSSAVESRVRRILGGR